MCNEDISIEEYKMIRKGLDDIYLTISNYNIALYTASGALFAFAFGKDEFYYCLIPLMVILPLYLLAEQKHKAACKLGAYLLVFCEGKTFNWCIWPPFTADEAVFHGQSGPCYAAGGR